MLVERYNAQTEEWVLLLHSIYEGISTQRVPVIDDVYKEFQEQWTLMTTEFLMMNKDAWELSQEEFDYVEDHFSKLGFVCPSFEQVEQVLSVDTISYLNSDGTTKRMAVLSVW